MFSCLVHDWKQLRRLTEEGLAGSRTDLSSTLSALSALHVLVYTVYLDVSYMYKQRTTVFRSVISHVALTILLYGHMPDITNTNNYRELYSFKSVLY